MKYAAIGSVITNKILYTDGSTVEDIMGGVVYAAEGLRLWQDEVGFVSNVGEDFDKYYGQWMKDNEFSYEGIKVKAKRCSYTCVEYHPDGTWHEYTIYDDPDHQGPSLGIVPTTPDDLTDEVCQNLRCMNIEAGLNEAMLTKARQMGDKYGFKVMWEISTSKCKPENLEKIKELCKLVDSFSINGPETCELFGVSTDEECIEKLIGLNVPFILFRVGTKGLYSIADGKSYFVPCRRYDGTPMDPTGCGNSSTATGGMAFAEGYHPLMCGIMANLTAHYNVRQFGPVLNMTKELREEMWAAANEEFARLSKEYGVE